MNRDEAIRRQDVLDLAKKGVLISNGNYESVCKAINELSPVNPQPCGDAIDRKLVCAFIAGLISDDGEREKGLEYIRNMPPVNPTKTGWIPVSERVAEFPCLACDIFEQIFIPCSIVVLDSRCYEGKDFAFNVEKFLRGKEAILCGGEKVYEKPREIVAWMPLPKPYKAESEE